MTKICDFDDKMNYSGDYSSTGYARLAKSLIDIVKEQQAKLGYIRISDMCPPKAALLPPYGVR